MTTITGRATRGFRDTGTEKSYVVGRKYRLDAGTFANFEAAGLMEPVTSRTAPRP